LSTLRKLCHLHPAGTTCQFMNVCDSRPPTAMLTVINARSTKPFRELQYADTGEEMVSRNRQSTIGHDHKAGGQTSMFETDTDGSKPKSFYIMGRRNWCCITLEQPSGDLLFDIRVEKEKGLGETVGYGKPSF
jgi:hypothetical protein